MFQVPVSGTITSVQSDSLEALESSPLVEPTRRFTPRFLALWVVTLVLVVAGMVLLFVSFFSQCQLNIPEKVSTTCFVLENAKVVVWSVSLVVEILWILSLGPDVAAVVRGQFTFAVSGTIYLVALLVSNSVIASRSPMFAISVVVDFVGYLSLIIVLTISGHVRRHSREQIYKARATFLLIFVLGMFVLVAELIMDNVFVGTLVPEPSAVFVSILAEISLNVELVRKCAQELFTGLKAQQQS